MINYTEVPEEQNKRNRRIGTFLSYQTNNILIERYFITARNTSKAFNTFEHSAQKYN